MTRKHRFTPDMRNGRTRKFIPNTVTILNMFLGFLSVLSAIAGNYEMAGWLIFAGAISDSLDGKLARALGTSSIFGIQFDSLADLITFCLAPSVLVYLLWAQPLGLVIGGFFAFMPLMMGAIRLARFNLEATSDQRHKFLGIPSPLMALTIVGLYLFYLRAGDFGLSSWTQRAPTGDSRVVLPLVMIVSSLMLSKIPFPKFPPLTFRHGIRASLPLLMVIVCTLGIFLTRGLILLPLALLVILTALVAWTQTQRLADNDSIEEPT